MEKVDEWMKKVEKYFFYIAAHKVCGPFSASTFSLYVAAAKYPSKRVLVRKKYENSFLLQEATLCFHLASSREFFMLHSIFSLHNSWYNFSKRQRGMREAKVTAVLEEKEKIVFFSYKNALLSVCRWLIFVKTYKFKAKIFYY